MNCAQVLPEPGYCRQPDRTNVESFYAWNNRSEVGIHKLDDQHRQLFSTLNRLHDHMMSFSAQVLIDKDLSNLIDQTETHFKTEEGIMQVRAYPGYALHKNLHELLLRQLDDVRSLVVGDYRHSWIERMEISEFLHTSLVLHIAEEDRKIGAFEAYEPGRG